MLNIKFSFFGTDLFALIVLQELEKKGLLPSLIVTVPDKPQGKNKEIINSPVKNFALKHNIPLLQPAKFDVDFASQLKAKSLQLSIVASYGKIIPQQILDIPKHKTLNIHPSLLPKLRGPSPLEYAILNEQKTGVTIIRLDNEMDHGPIVAQEESTLLLPIKRSVLEQTLAKQGTDLIVQILPKLISGTLEEIEQNHSDATYTEKVSKNDGLIDLNKPIEAYKKILAFEGWPGAYFFVDRNEKQIRVIVLEAKLNEDGSLNIIKVKPEGKNEMLYTDFLRGDRK